MMTEILQTDRQTDTEEEEQLLVLRLDNHTGVKVTRYIWKILSMSYSPNYFYATGMTLSLVGIATKVVYPQAVYPAFNIVTLGLMLLGVAFGLSPAWVARQSYLKRRIRHAEVLDNMVGNSRTESGKKAATAVKERVVSLEHPAKVFFNHLLSFRPFGTGK